MPDNRRLSRALVALLLAVPVFAAAYVAFFGGRVWAAMRPAFATVLGATVIGSVYADEAIKRVPATPMRATAVLALAVALVGPGMAPAPAAAASDPAEAVIAAAREYLDHPFQMGAEGPRFFDCSGLVFRMFSDAGELPRIGGMRLLAAGYMRYFVSRGLYTKDQDKAERGDLVVWDNGEHIGIYLGDGKALSALVNPWGVTVHSLHGIHLPVSYFLKVDWSTGDGSNGNGNGDNPGDGNGDNPGDGNGDNPGDGNGDNPGDGNGDGNDNTVGPRDGRVGDSNGANRGVVVAPGDGNSDPGNGEGPAEEPDATSGIRAVTTGTLNLRASADPQARIIGWVGRGTSFKITDRGNSPAGWLWYQIQTANGKQGWVWSYWTRPVN